MRANKLGIEGNKEEFAALLAFAGDDTTYGVIRFRVNAIGKLVVTATDGKRAVEHTANAEDHEPGEWAFDRTFIEALRRQTDKGETVAVIVAGAKKAKAIFRGVETTAERGEFQCPATQFSTQITMDAVHETVTGKDSERLRGSWFAFNPAFIADLDKVTKAANGCPCTLFPPSDSGAMVHFQVSSDRGVWRGCFKPTLVVAPGEEAETDEPDPDAPGSTTQDLPSSAPPKLELTNQLGVAKKKKAKASKEPKKETKSRKPKTPPTAADDAETTAEAG